MAVKEWGEPPEILRLHFRKPCTAVRSIIKQIQLVIVRGEFGTVGGLGNH
jgi:hypothetical protein